MKKRDFYLWPILLLFLGAGITYFVDSSRHKEYQAKIEKESQENLEILRTGIKGLFCKKYTIMEEIASDIVSHPKKEKEIIEKYRDKMKPWELTLIKDFPLQKDSGGLTSFLKAVRENPFEKVLTIEKTGNKVKALHIAYLLKTGSILLASVSPRTILNKGCSSTLLSRYYINLYAKDFFGIGREDELLVNNGKIPEKSKRIFSLTFPIARHRHNLTLKIIPKTGTGHRSKGDNKYP